MHSNISSLYNNLANDLYFQNYAKIKILIDEDAENEFDKEKLLKSFKIFEIKSNKQIMEKSILEEYKKKIFLTFLNKKIKKINLNDGIIYFTSRFMSTLNSYAQMKGKYFHENEIYIGKNMPFSTILKFEKEKGKIIFFSDFKIATETLNNAQRTAIRFLPKQNYDKNGFFSVLFTIKINKENYFQNGIKVGIILVFWLTIGFI